MWSLNFVSDALFNGQRPPLLMVVAAFTRKALAIDIDQGIKGEQGVAAVTRIVSVCGVPRIIRFDNGRSIDVGERRHA